ncbi:hypothetical protein [Spirosoma oryzicola]|uniref:hypothetical protein n=1 Tax=Spirosoma oryzicola TaxID=2898794 RepID=UPI001E2FAD20|nr:hypothetical protein [Spirosoma oryzicola]UHG90114.1 hypothetical protein LQ777_17900 [Spirosoma oryzicola]
MAINLNETATLTLKGNTRDFDNELLQLNTKAKQLKDTLKEIEKSGGKGGEEWKKYKNELAAVNTETAKVRKEVDLTQLSYSQLKTLVGQLNKDLSKLKPGTDEFNAAAKRLAEAEKQFKAVGKQIDDIKKQSDDLGKPTMWQKITSGVGTVQKAFQAFIALQIIGYIVDIGKAIFETTAKFEKYEKTLTTALGSEKQAKESMAALKKLGAETAFTVDELTEGYVKMVNRGMRPSQKEMVALTDLAASQGKSFDQLVEAALDAQTGEFERLKEFGIRASKAGDTMSFSFKGAGLEVKRFGDEFQVVDKANGKVVESFKSQDDAIQNVMVRYGQMNGVGGQNAKMMETLGGMSSNLEDNFDSLKVELGEKLRPVFVLVLQSLSGGITVIRGLVNVISTAITGVIAWNKTLFDFFISSGGVFKNMGLAIKEFLSGNFDAASKYWDQTKLAGQKVIDGVKANAKQGADSIVAIWTDKSAGQKAEFAGKDQGQKFQGGLSKEQEKAIKDREKAAEKAAKKAEADHQKHLQEVQKANEKALEELAKLETEAHIAGIKDEMQREFAKLQAKRDLAAEEIMRGIQDEKIKNQQIANLDKKLQEDITRVAGEFAEKKRKKAEEEETKRLAVEKLIIDQQQKAENALFDWRELKAKGNAAELTRIHKERSDAQLRLTIDKLDAEEAAEKAKAAKEATTTEQKEQAITAIEGRFHNERQLAEKKHADEIAKIDKELQEKKKENWGHASSAFTSLLKGDLSGFVEHADKLVQGNKSAWQKKLQDDMAGFEAAAQMATAAVGFLNQLAQKKAEAAIAAAKKERDEKVALLNDQLAIEKAAQDAAEFEKQKVTQESNDKISAIKSATQATISSLEQQYRQLSSSEEKKKLDEQLSGYKENADGKKEAAKDTAQAAIEAAQDEAKQSIDAAQRTEKEAIKSATNEKNEKIDAAEATRDAEVAAINKRKDIDQATRQQLLSEAKAAFETAKKQATDEAEHKIDAAKDTAKAQTELAKDTAKTKIELAKDEQDAELKAIEAVQKGDEKAAKEILAKAKEDQKEKIRLAKEEADKKIEEAEKEKREKLKKVEAEKQTRIQNQKELNRSIEAENKKAAATEAEAKRKAWEAQKKADVASALIAGALATIKALASGFFPINLVFAATTAVMTGIQVAMIKSQPAPQFRHGGFIPSGGRHGSEYGRGGIALIDRATGRDVGEMEGDEAIISREQTAANLPLINEMFRNARTPGKRDRPVTLNDRNAMGKPAGFKDGGLFTTPYWKQEMHLFGSKKAKKAAEEAQREAEEAAAQAAADAEAAAASAGDYGSDDYSSLAGSAEAKAAQEKAEKQGEEQLKLLAKIVDSVDKMSSDQKLLFGNLALDIRQGLNYLSSDTIKGLEALRTGQSASFDKLNTTLRNVLLSMVLTQNASTDELVDAIVKGMSSLETRSTSESTRIIAAIKAASEKASGDITKAIDTSGNSQRLLLAGISIKLGTGFSESTDAMVKAIDTSGNKLLLSLMGLNQTTKTGLEKVQDQVKQDAIKLAKTTEDGFDKLLKRGDNNLNDLTENLEFLFNSLGNRTEKVINTNGLAERQSLDKLTTTTKTGLETLNKDQTKAIDSLSKNVTKSVDDSAKSTKDALEKLGDAVTDSIDELNNDQQQALTKLGDEVTDALKDLNTDQTEALDKLSDAVTKSLDELSQDTDDALDSLSKNVTKSVDDSAKSTKEALEKLSDAVTDSLDELNKDQQQALGKLSNEVTDSLEVLNKDQKQALGQLSDEVTDSVELLNKDQKQALGTLGDKTEAALKDSANRTTSSVDGLSVEVRSLKGSINSVEGAVWQVRGAVNGVEGAVYGTNQAGRLDALIAGISTFGGK